MELIAGLLGAGFLLDLLAIGVIVALLAYARRRRDGASVPPAPVQQPTRPEPIDAGPWGARRGADDPAPSTADWLDSFRRNSMKDGGTPDVPVMARAEADRTADVWPLIQRTGVDHDEQ